MTDAELVKELKRAINAVLFEKLGMAIHVCGGKIKTCQCRIREDGDKLIFNSVDYIIINLEE